MTFGWASKYFATFSAFSECFLIRNVSVSSPCMNANACTGASVAPRSLSSLALILTMYADSPKSPNTSPW